MRGNNLRGLPKQMCSVHPDNWRKKEEEREIEVKEKERERGRARETRETAQNYAALLMKQSPLRPCYLDVRTRGTRIMLRGFGGRVQPSRRRARFPAGPLGASGPGPRVHRRIKAGEEYFGHET